MRMMIVSVAVGLISFTQAAEEPKFVPAGSAPSIPFPGHATAHLAHSHDTPAGTAVLELTILPKSLGAPPHSHGHEDEYFYVLEGSVDFLERGQIITASKGALMILPRGHVHGFWNASDAPAKLLLIISPGDFDGFFEDVVARIRKENIDSPERVGALIAQAAAERGVQIFPEQTPDAAKALMK